MYPCTTPCGDIDCLDSCIHFKKGNLIMHQTDYMQQFHTLRLNDADFAAQYDAHEFDLWYADISLEMQQEAEFYNQSFIQEEN